MGISRQECWSELPCPSPGNLPNPGTEPWSLTCPALAGRFFTTSTTWELSIFPNLMVISNESALHIRWPKYWSFGISASNEYSGLISFRIDWFDLLAIQGTLKSLLQHHSLKASILQCSSFFMVQLSYPMITGKTIALTIQMWECFFADSLLYLSLPDVTPSSPH